ncbi:hypothetical protein PCIT_a0005 [Pseudoalteromonas citrea]|uniref:LysM domain-containing protein n=2 Tax=Pseudoalteromonas citrea TaxID=43655 RepID=A0AAD4AJZ0_9GAMM|nr:peptidoglycan-binding protein [Pseudoalteromonas citrea]KAF7773701.1 hypothetical protein PCIT_a0005 [Pseudoalteromonas citrea]
MVYSTDLSVAPAPIKNTHSAIETYRVPPSLLGALPPQLKASVRDANNIVVSRSSAALLRDHPQCTFWVSDRKTWNKRGYQDYIRAEQGLAIVPKAVVEQRNSAEQHAIDAHNPLTWLTAGALTPLTNQGNNTSNITQPQSTITDLIKRDSKVNAKSGPLDAYHQHENTQQVIQQRSSIAGESLTGQGNAKHLRTSHGGANPQSNTTSKNTKQTGYTPIALQHQQLDMANNTVLVNERTQTTKQGLYEASKKQVKANGPQHAVRPGVPTVKIYTPELNSQWLLERKGPINRAFVTHIVNANDTALRIAEQYSGMADPNLVYNYNLGVTEQKPAPVGTPLRVPSGWELEVEGSACNTQSVLLQWQGPTSGEAELELEKRPIDSLDFWHYKLPIEPGDYQLTVSSRGVYDETHFTVKARVYTYHISLLDEQQQPIKHAKYQARLKSGHIIEGELDEAGQVTLSSPLYESLKVNFTELDAQDWGNAQGLGNTLTKVNTAFTQQYTVAQGDTLLRIAKLHGFYHAECIYQHPSNHAFRTLRPDPNLLYPGDTLNIPAKAVKFSNLRENQNNIFARQAEHDMFRLRVEAANGDNMVGKKVVVTLGEQTFEGVVASNGLIEFAIQDHTALTGQVEIYPSLESDTPIHTFTVQVAHLDPITSLSGVQGRCNALGFECGKVDGLNGPKTRAGVRQFQQVHKLTVDAIAGPNTQAKLQQVYGS